MLGGWKTAGGERFAFKFQISKSNLSLFQSQPNHGRNCGRRSALGGGKVQQPPILLPEPLATSRAGLKFLPLSCMCSLSLTQVSSAETQRRFLRIFGYHSVICSSHPQFFSLLQSPWLCHPLLSFLSFSAFVKNWKSYLDLLSNCCNWTRTQKN